MPYNTTSDLPGNIQSILPKEAQKIYMGAFNGCIADEKNDESACYAIAWTAVKEKFVKNKITGKWKKKPEKK